MMNNVEVVYDCNNPFKARAFLNGVEVTRDTVEIRLQPDGAYIDLLETPRIVEGNELKKQTLKLTDLKLITGE